MPVTAQWDNAEQTAVRLDFIGFWTWDEFHAANQQIGAYLDAVTYKVDLIADATHSGALPSGALTHARTVIANSRTNRRLMIIVGANVLIKMFYPVLKKLYVGRARLPEIIFVDTLADARQLLRDRYQVNHPA